MCCCGTSVCTRLQIEHVVLTTLFIFNIFANIIAVSYSASSVAQVSSHCTTRDIDTRRTCASSVAQVSSHCTTRDIDTRRTCADSKRSEWESKRTVEIETLKSNLQSLEEMAEGGAQEWALLKQGRERELGERESRLRQKQEEEREMWKANEATRRAQEVCRSFSCTHRSSIRHCHAFFIN